MQDNLKYYNKEGNLKQFNLVHNLKYFNLEDYLKYCIMKDDLKYFLKCNTTSNIFANEIQPKIIQIEDGRFLLIAGNFCGSNSAQLQLKQPTGADLGNKKLPLIYLFPMWKQPNKYNQSGATTDRVIRYGLDPHQL